MFIFSAGHPENAVIASFIITDLTMEIKANIKAEGKVLSDKKETAASNLGDLVQQLKTLQSETNQLLTKYIEENPSKNAKNVEQEEDEEDDDEEKEEDDGANGDSPAVKKAKH